MKRPPPLTTLPVLEAAARHGSYSLAAEELHVTHGAVSHQIRSLEDHVGVKLFVRTGRGVTITPEGAALAERVRGALAEISDALEAANPVARKNKLVISVLPSFGSRWLLPRLGRFLELHPNLQVSVEASQGLSNFRTDGVDVAVRFGAGNWHDVRSEKLANDSYFAVCSPRFRRGKLPAKPAQLASLPLFQSSNRMWEKWFAAAGLNCEPILNPINYNDATLYLQQAAAGEGIALTRRSLVEADLQRGRLVKLFDIEIPAENAYYLVCLPAMANVEKIRAFRDWLIREIDWQQLPQTVKNNKP